MNPTPPRTSSTPDGASRPGVPLLPLALWFAIITGLLEIAVPVRDRLAEDRFLLDPQIVWMAPLTDAVLFALLAGVFALVARLTRRPMFGAAVATFSWLAMWSGPYLLPGLYRSAVLILAAGIAIQLARFAMRHEAMVARVVRVTLAPLVAVVLLLAAAVHVPRVLGERRALAALPAAPAGAKHVILLILDTVRARSLSLYGYARPTTPHLARFASASVRFDRAIVTAPWTLPSHASMFTGRWPHDLSFGWSRPLDDGAPVLAEYLSRRGWATGGFVANLLYTTRESGLSRGFAHYEDYPTTPGQAFISSSIGRLIAEQVEKLVDSDFLFGRKHGRQVSDAMLDWIDHGRPRSAPFFAFVNYYDAHDPYEPDEAFTRQFVANMPQTRRAPGKRVSADEASRLRDLYEAAIAELDAEIGRLLGELEGRGLLDSTVVIIASDHGEEFQEHGVMGHGNSLYRPSLRVPLLIRLPGAARGGTVVTTPVSLRSIPATVVDALGLAEGSPFPGRSLLAAAAERDPILSELNAVSRALAWAPIAKGDMRSLIYGPYHYIRDGDRTEQLFDVEHDPNETSDLARGSAARRVLEHLRATLDSMLAAPAPRT